MSEESTPPQAPDSPQAPDAKTASLREEVKSIEAKLVSPTLDLQTKMELKARKQTLERQIRDMER